MVYSCPPGGLLYILQMNVKLCGELSMNIQMDNFKYVEVMGT